MPPDHTPQRIVSLQPSATVILAALGRLARVVACTRYCAEVCPQAAQGGRLIVADSWTAQSEQIKAANPDLVIAAVPFQEKALAEILKAGARFLGLAPRTLADICTDIAAIAGIVGATAQGEMAVAEMQAEIEALREKTRGLARPRVFCEEWGKPLITSQPWVAELVEAAGGEFIGTPGAQSTFQSVQEANPDVLVAAWCGAGDRVSLEKIVRDRAWEGMQAVQARRVYCIPDEWLNTPAPTLLRGLHALAGALHPEKFPSVPRLRRITNATPRSQKLRPK